MSTKKAEFADLLAVSEVYRCKGSPEEKGSQLKCEMGNFRHESEAKEIYGSMVAERKRQELRENEIRKEKEREVYAHLETLSWRERLVAYMRGAHVDDLRVVAWETEAIKTMTAEIGTERMIELIADRAEDNKAFVAYQLGYAEEDGEKNRREAETKFVRSRKDVENEFELQWKFREAELRCLERKSAIERLKEEAERLELEGEATVMGSVQAEVSIGAQDEGCSEHHESLLIAKESSDSVFPNFHKFQGSGKIGALEMITHVQEENDSGVVIEDRVGYYQSGEIGLGDESRESDFSEGKLALENSGESENSNLNEEKIVPEDVIEEDNRGVGKEEVCSSPKVVNELAMGSIPCLGARNVQGYDKVQSFAVVEINAVDYVSEEIRGVGTLDGELVSSGISEVSGVGREGAKAVIHGCGEVQKGMGLIKNEIRPKPVKDPDKGYRHDRASCIPNVTVSVDKETGVYHDRYCKELIIIVFAFFFIIIWIIRIVYFCD